MQLRPNTKIAVSLSLSVLSVLTAVRLLIWKIPNPLLLFILAMFFLVFLAFCIRYRNKVIIGLNQIATVILTWISITGFALILVYHIDKGGWNWFKLTGYDVARTESYPDAMNLSVGQWSEKYPFFRINPEDSSEVTLLKGVYEFDQTVVVPKNLKLIIEPGVTVRLAAGCSLLTYSPIYARGTDADPIVFTAKNRLLKWGSIGIVDTEKSFFEHTIFEHGRWARINDFTLWAGLSVIRSDVEALYCRFENMFGRDAMNVQYGHVVIRNCIFKNVYKDGLDLDGGTGEISQNQFFNCGDEGIDLSENFDVRVFENLVVCDKGGRIDADNDLDQILSLNTLKYAEN